ncbi:MAG: PQQ-binding-like beta-propeller repeat protein [Planctomycetota bacterium]|nr:MAG: PQQ-binding-like beta-propeller repeat protein [Planctomycetota bacterium]
MIFTTAAVCLAAIAQTTPTPPAPPEHTRHILAADPWAGHIALLAPATDAAGDSAPGFEITWEHPISAIHDLHVLDSGHILFQDSWTHILEVDPETGETVWEYDAARQNRRPADGPVEVHAFSRMPDGTTMIAESGPGRLIFVDAEGNIDHQFKFTLSRNDPHRDTRLVRPTPQGTFLAAHEGEGVVREYDTEGNVVWEFAVPLFGKDRAGGHGFDAWGNAVFSAIRLDNGNTLIGTGNGHRVLEVSPGGEIVWQVTQDELPGIRLAWVTTLQVLESGNIVIGNCHAGPDQPQLVEITKDKEVVWTFHDFERFDNALSNAWVIEADVAGATGAAVR